MFYSDIFQRILFINYIDYMYWQVKIKSYQSTMYVLFTHHE